MISIDSLFSCFESEETPISSTADNNKFLKRNKDFKNETYPSPKKKKSETNSEHHCDMSIETNINTQTIMNEEGCIHEVVYDTNEQISELLPSDIPAKEYKFTLDRFQKQAILCIENNQSVLVSAHTSAGKTVVAEYAIALSLKNKQRIIYTTPIKALSNQKYRELLDEFKDVGLMTGDVTIDKNASCIVMTTEILRSMLYRGSEMIKEIGWVIFDEIHYMRDVSRGIVWEETIILLPHNVRHVFLSATIPNARQFAEWICHLHKHPCNVVYTEQRPTPLQHYIFPVTGDKMLLIVDEKGEFQDLNYDAAIAITNEQTHNPISEAEFDKFILEVVKYAMNENLAPLIVFCFSRTNCEHLALGLRDTNYNTEEEQQLIVEIYNNAISILSEEDKLLPHIKNAIPLLKRGIAFHHSGLLPVLKETTEILFGEGLIKVLFATETFSMGLNMPAKTVIFTRLKKFDGNDKRFVTSGEYIQMSGRAGRRGIDDKGIVISISNNIEVTHEMKSIIYGKANPLNSKFHLTYSMILNLLRQEEINPEYIIDKSFLHFQNQSKLSEKLQLLQEKKKSYVNIEKLVDSYMAMKNRLTELHEKMKEIIMKPEYISRFLHPGRLIKLKILDVEYDWGVVLNTDFSDKNCCKLSVLSRVADFRKFRSNPKRSSSTPKVDTEINVFNVDIKSIFLISSETVNANFMRRNKGRKKRNKEFNNMMRELKAKFPNELPLLHPIADMNVDNESVLDLLEEICGIQPQIYQHPLHRDFYRGKSWRDQKEYYKKKIINIEKDIKISSHINMLDELKKRKSVLRALGYCDEKDIITVKGRIACEFSSNELLLTEMILSGILSEIPVNDCVALLSCILCQENTEGIYNFSNDMNRTLKNVKQIISKIDGILRDIRIFEDENETIHPFQVHMIDVILAWCQGSSFLDTCKITTVYEGAIIRYMRGIDELLKQLYKAARNIGNTDLEVKFSEGIKRLKRGIVFAASLYL